jgi:hypothetical protein
LNGGTLKSTASLKTFGCRVSLSFHGITTAADNYLRAFGFNYGDPKIFILS